MYYLFNCRLLFPWNFLKPLCLCLPLKRRQLLHFAGFFVPDCSIFSEQPPNFSFLFTKIDLLYNWKQIMKIGPESFMFSYEFSKCVNLLCLCMTSAPGREGGQESEGRQPPFNRMDKNTTCHLLKELSLFSTTVLSIPYTCRT